MNPQAYFENLVKRAPSNAMTPLLWVNFMITVPCLTAAYFETATIRYAFFALGTVIALFSCWEFRCLRKTNPRHLISEHMQYEMQKLDMIAEKGGGIRFGVVDVDLTTDPQKRNQKPSNEEESHG